MLIRLRLCVLAGLLIATPVTALGQKKGHVGLTMGYPASVGLVWHVAERVAVRPEFSFSKSTSDAEEIIDASSSGWTLGVGVSGLFYVSRTDNLRTYVSPRYTYSRGSSTSRTSGLFGDELENELDSSIHTITGSFGAQYALSSRFSAFGEVGVGYARTSLRGSLSGVRSKSHGWATRTGAGFILYF